MFTTVIPGVVLRSSPRVGLLDEDEDTLALVHRVELRVKLRRCRRRRRRRRTGFIWKPFRSWLVLGRTGSGDTGF